MNLFEVAFAANPQLALSPVGENEEGGVRCSKVLQEERLATLARGAARSAAGNGPESVGADGPSAPCPLPGRN